MNIAVRIGLATACLLLFAGDRAPAQNLEFGARGFGGSYGPGMENLNPGRGGAASYLPSGGGFLPYTPGPGGGLGVQPKMRDSTPGPTSGAMTMPGSSTLGGFGGASGRLAPPAPITGQGGRGGMGSGLFMNGSPGGMRPRSMQSRPPVGFYPFQIPPSLGGPASQGPAMSM